LNPYMDYQKRSQLLPNAFEYWNIYSFFLGFKFWDNK
jgi:hypothetical protein